MEAAAPRGAGRDEACAGEGESAPAGGLPRDAACLSHEANDRPVSRRRRGPPSPRGAPARRSHGRGRPRGCRASPPGAGARAAAVLLRRGEGRTEGRLGASGRVRSARPSAGVGAADARRRRSCGRGRKPGSGCQVLYWHSRAARGAAARTRAG